MIVGILVALIVVLTIIILWLPLNISIDTRIPEIRAEWKGIASCSLIFADDRPYLCLHTWVYTHRWLLGAKSDAKKPEKQYPVKKKRHSRGRSTHSRGNKAVRLIKSFHIVRMELALDTSDVTVNAMLYPLNFYPYPPEKHIHINFLGKNHLLLRIRNTPWRMLRAWYSS